MQIYSDKFFENKVDFIEIFKPEEIQNGFICLENLRKKNLHIIGYMRYDLSKKSKYPLMYFEAYDNVKKYSPQFPNKNAGILIKPKISKNEYFRSIENIKRQIYNGITYEVNYTYPSEVFTNLDDFELYEWLLSRQKTPYNAFLQNKYEKILSFSPELFFKLKGNKIYTKPMKGTAPKAENQREFLYNDIKNRAENIMIVDLLRNDLGRIAKPGTVKVEKLFDIEEHSTVYQMTSEILAEIDEKYNLYDIFKAIYPCGSITGAPKISTMQVIKNVEKYPREVYCGAIGYMYGDEAVFSVPIRILQKKANDSQFTYFAGGAVVWDSTAQEEWEETLTKTKFLETPFSILETAVSDWDLHVKRMKKSAFELGFKWNDEIENIELKSDKVTRVILNKDGSYSVEYRDLPITEYKPKVKLYGEVNSANPFLYHKTTIRDAMPDDVFEYIKVNEKGQVTEGIFTNIGILKDGNYYTPPIECGLLNGVYRQKLNWKEKILYPSDLISADKVFCFNSVRGLIEVELCL